MKRFVLMAGGTACFLLLIVILWQNNGTAAASVHFNTCPLTARNVDGVEMPLSTDAPSQVGVPYPPASVLKGGDKRAALAAYAKEQLALITKDASFCEKANDAASKTACETVEPCTYSGIEAKFAMIGKKVSYAPSTDPDVCKENAKGKDGRCMALDVSGVCETNMRCSMPPRQSSSGQSSSIKEQQCFICHHYTESLNEEGKSVCSEAKNETECKYPESKEGGRQDCKWVGDACINLSGISALRP